MKLPLTESQISDINEESVTSKSLNLKTNYRPILICVDSRILGISNHKFLVTNKTKLETFVNSIKERLTGLDPKDILEISAVPDCKIPFNKIVLNDFSMNINYIYELYHDKHTKCLILSISRQTTYKVLKSYIWSFLGY